jgi:hypothetical protein
MLPKSRLLFLIRFPLEQAIVKPACPEEWVVIPPNEQTPSILMCVMETNNTKLSFHTPNTGHHSVENDACLHFVKCPGKSIKEMGGGVQYQMEGNSFRQTGPDHL